MKHLLILILALSTLFNLNAQELNKSNNDCPPEDAGKLIIKQNKIKALYLHEFISSVEYSKVKNEQFKVAFLRADTSKLNVKWFFDRTISSKDSSTIQSFSISQMNEIADYQMVYVDCNYEFDQEQLIKALGNSQTLIITDSKEENLMLNIKIHNCKVQYEINQDAMLQNGLKASMGMVKGSLNYL